MTRETPEDYEVRRARTLKQHGKIETPSEYERRTERSRQEREAKRLRLEAEFDKVRESTRTWENV